jgi:signal peptidase II
MTYFKCLLLIGIILISCVGCDQTTKALAKNHLSQAQPISYLGDILRLHYMENVGAFLSLGSSLSAQARFWVLCVLTGSAVAGMLAFILIKRSLCPSFVAGLSLIIAGGIGNLIDRVFNNGAVIDFMNIGIGGLRTGIFNIADVAIMAGALTLIFFGSRPDNRPYAYRGGTP